MSFPMRSKEDAQDYRYFPEPDLLTIVVDKERIKALKEQIPELPNIKIKRYVSDYSLSQIDATLIAEDMEKSSLFDLCCSMNKCKPKSISNWILGDISKYTNETGKLISETNLTADKLCSLIEKIEKGVISNSAGKTVFEELMKNNGDIDSIINEKGLAQNSDSDFIEKLVKEVFAENEKSINDYKNGKTNALGYLVGQCMKASKGKANPGIVKDTVTKMLQL